jgi:hypothetical protein
MLKKFLPLIIAAAFGVAAAQVEAMPLPSLDGASAPPVTLVYGGCGIYGHRGPYGHCRPGGQAGGYWGGGVSPCPYGWHIGPYGRHCWRNW